MKKQVKSKETKDVKLVATKRVENKKRKGKVLEDDVVEQDVIIENKKEKSSKKVTVKVSNAKEVKALPEAKKTKNTAKVIKDTKDVVPLPDMEEVKEVVKTGKRTTKKTAEKSKKEKSLSNRSSKSDKIKKSETTCKKDGVPRAKRQTRIKCKENTIQVEGGTREIKAGDILVPRKGSGRQKALVILDSGIYEIKLSNGQILPFTSKGYEYIFTPVKKTPTGVICTSLSRYNVSDKREADVRRFIQEEEEGEKDN